MRRFLSLQSEIEQKSKLALRAATLEEVVAVQNLLEQDERAGLRFGSPPLLPSEYQDCNCGGSCQALS